MIKARHTRLPAAARAAIGALVQRNRAVGGDPHTIGRVAALRETWVLFAFGPQRWIALALIVRAILMLRLSGA